MKVMKNNGVINVNVKKLVAIILLFFIITFSGGFKILGMTTGFTTENMSPKEQKLFLSNMKITLLDTDVKSESMSCFDVSDEGLVALGFINNTICVYNHNGDFKYGYSFDCSGSFGVEWDDENLLVYFVRSDIAVLLDNSATCLEIKEISNSIQNNTYWNHTVFAEKRLIGKDKFEIKNDLGILNIFTTSYSKLVKTNENGIETVIYDISNHYRLKVLLMLFGIILFIIIVVCVIIKQIKKTKTL